MSNRAETLHDVYVNVKLRPRSPRGERRARRYTHAPCSDFRDAADSRPWLPFPDPHSSAASTRRRFPRRHRHRRRRRAAGRRHAGRLDRGHHRVHARQRPARAAVSGRDQADGHRQRHVSGRLAPRELRRDGHGAPARAPDVQGHAVDRERLPGARPPRDALQRLDVVRPHQLLRDVHRLRRESRLGARDGGRPHGERFHRAEGPRHRDDGRAQRVRERREQSAAGALGPRSRRPRTTGTTTATRRSARARTSRTSTSAGCRRSTGSTTSPTTPC